MCLSHTGQNFCVLDLGATVIVEVLKRLCRAIYSMSTTAQISHSPPAACTQSSGANVQAVRDTRSACPDQAPADTSSGTSLGLPSGYQVTHLGPPPVPVVTLKPKKGSRKVLLQPGHSLPHWIERTKTGEDLTNGAGLSQCRLITREELAKHCTADDAWMCIRSKVYDITRYLDYHPGGVDVLLEEAGKDATKLFDENHRWVNIDRMLGQCQVGIIKSMSLAV